MLVYALLALYQLFNSINNILIASPPWLAVLLWVWTINATPLQVMVLRDVGPRRMWVYVSWAERTYPEQASPRRQDEARPAACRGWRQTHVTPDAQDTPNNPTLLWPVLYTSTMLRYESCLEPPCALKRCGYSACSVAEHNAIVG